MAEMPHADLLHQSIDSELDRSLDALKTILNYPKNEDAQFREYRIGSLRVCAAYIEGMADEERIAEFVLHAIKGARDVPPDPAKRAEWLNERLIEIAQSKSITENSEAIPAILSGMTCLLIDGAEEALLLETRNYPHRSVEQPTTEAVVGGPHEGFNEHFRTNISLIRRYVQSPELITQKMTVGTRIPTQIAILYLNGVAEEKCVQEVKRRLMCIQAAKIGGIGQLQQYLEDRPYALLPQMLETERPDRAASCLEDGQIAIICENSPYALIAPVTIFHLIHASDDSFMRWQYGTTLRVIRMAGILVSLLLPALYIAVTHYHTHLIPISLLTSIAESRTNVPFPILVEVLFMEFSFYLLNEAGMRTPKQIGSAFGIIRALVLGQAAVSASIISPILIIIIALTGLGSYAIPNFGFGVGLMLYRLLLVLLSALLGIYGVILGMFLILAHLCSMKSFGVDYLAPVAPHRSHNPDILLRLPVWRQRRILFFAAPDSWMREKKEVKNR